MFVSEVTGDHIVEAYSIIGLVIALYVVSMVSFCLPYFVVVRDLRMFMVFAAFSLTLVICLLKVNLGSKVTPNILGYHDDSPCHRGCHTVTFCELTRILKYTISLLKGVGTNRTMRLHE